MVAVECELTCAHLLKAAEMRLFWEFCKYSGIKMHDLETIARLSQQPFLHIA
jgi:hypothetical protein